MKINVQSGSLRGRTKWIIIKQTHNLKAKTEFIAVYFETQTRCLPCLAPSLQCLQSFQPCWLKCSRTCSVVSTCVSRRRDSKFGVFCSPIIITSTKICIHQVPFLSINYCVIYIYIYICICVCVNSVALACERSIPSERSHLSAKLVSNISDRGCRLVSATDPHGRILCFLDRCRYCLFQIAPVNRTRDLSICSHELWPLDHKGDCVLCN
jgi:hypothetical protein